MSIDIAISAATAVLTILMAYLGVHVSLHPADSRLQKSIYKISFFFCAALSVALIVWQGHRNANSQRLFSLDVSGARAEAKASRADTERLRTDLTAQNARREQAEKDLGDTVQKTESHLSTQMTKTESALSTNINTYRIDTTTAVSRLIKPDRHLTEQQKTAIRGVAASYCPLSIEERSKHTLAVVWEPNGESAEYADDFIQNLSMPGCEIAFYRKELRPIGQQIVGISVLTKDWQHPSQLALTVRKVMLDAGIQFITENGSIVNSEVAFVIGAK